MHGARPSHARFSWRLRATTRSGSGRVGSGARAPSMASCRPIRRWRGRWTAGGCRRIRSRRCLPPPASPRAEVPMRAYIAVAGALLLAACYHGPSIYTFDPVQRPTGVDADLRLAKTRVSGELLEVQDSALIVLTESNKVVAVLLRVIRDGTFDKLGTLIVEGFDTKSALARLRPFS